VVAKSHDMAYDVGTFELTLNDDKGRPSTVVGKFLVAWKKQKSGEWKVEADCFNTNK
jgi:ketosteroid isomerase-like protein